MSDLVFLLALVVIGVLVYYYVLKGDISRGCVVCPGCNQQKAQSDCPVCPDCPHCLVTEESAQKVLDNFAKGCTQRIQGVVRQNEASPEDVQKFMMDGPNRLVIVTNLDPETIAKAIYSKHPAELKKLNLVAISSTVINGKKMYIVMGIVNGQIAPIGAPTEKFAEAFAYLERTAQKQLGNDPNSLVFYIDEDIPCPDDEGLTPLHYLPYPPQTEKCCGRRD